MLYKKLNLDFFFKIICILNLINFVFTMEHLRFYFVTYNVATKHPDQDLRSLLNLSTHPKNDSDLPDFYVVALQEVKAQPQSLLLDAIFDDHWTNYIREILANRDYVKAKSIRLQGIILTFFSLRKHLLHLRDIETTYTRTGLSGIWGNKGAVSIRFNIYGCSICIVNSHLAAHDHLLQDRIDDYNAIVKQQEYHIRETSKIFFHDYVFWLGDLNFRLSNDGTLSGQEIESLIKKGQYKQLLEKDQLKLVMESGDAFSELSENLPQFPPTFKFEMGTSKYDLKRRPSWCDRILFRVNKDNYENVTLFLEQLSYKSHDQYVMSDHKPVTSDFKLKVFKDLSERLVDFSSIPIWYLDEVNSATVKLGLDVEATSTDWIGIFKDGFSSLDDYLGYVYVLKGSSPVAQPRRARNSQIRNTYSVQFPESIVRSAGMYRLVYFSQTPHNVVSVLGMSNAFHIQQREGFERNHDRTGTY